MVMSDENQEIYNNLCNKAIPIFQTVVLDKNHSDDYIKGFTDGFNQIKLDLVEVLTSSQRRSISSKGHQNIIETLLKVVGKIEAFYHLVEINKLTQDLYILISDDLSYLQEIVQKDFR